MKKYNKLIGAIVGGLISIAVPAAAAHGLDLAWLEDPAVQESIAALGILLGIWAAPANRR